MDEGGGGDATDHVLKLEGVAVEGAGPADFGVELDGDAFVSHEGHHVLIDFVVELVEHVAAHVIPVVAALMTGGEATGACAFVEDGDGDAGTGENAGGVETAGTAAEDGYAGLRDG